MKHHTVKSATLHSRKSAICNQVGRSHAHVSDMQYHLVKNTCRPSSHTADKPARSLVQAVLQNFKHTTHEKGTQLWCNRSDTRQTCR